MAAVHLATYQRRFKALHNATMAHEWKKFEDTIAFFERYGEQYGFDHLMLAAQGYQESRLNQSARIRAGAVGIMQLMPATGKELDVGDINKAEPNVHGGTKYMRILLDRHFKEADFDQQNPTLFAFASYNAGPSCIAKIRAEAKKQGLNPNKRFVKPKRVGSFAVTARPIRMPRSEAKASAAPFSIAALDTGKIFAFWKRIDSAFTAGGSRRPISARTFQFMEEGRLCARTSTVHEKAAHRKRTRNFFISARFLFTPLTFFLQSHHGCKVRRVRVH